MFVRENRLIYHTAPGPTFGTPIKHIVVKETVSVIQKIRVLFGIKHRVKIFAGCHSLPFPQDKIMFNRADAGIFRFIRKAIEFFIKKRFYICQFGADVQSN